MAEKRHKIGWVRIELKNNEPISAEIFSASEWGDRSSYIDLYPQIAWDGLFRLRLGRRWFRLARDGWEYPFITWPELWTVLGNMCGERKARGLSTSLACVAPVAVGDVVTVSNRRGSNLQSRIMDLVQDSLGIFWVKCLQVDGYIPCNAVLSRKDSIEQTHEGLQKYGVPLAAWGKG